MKGCTHENSNDVLSRFCCNDAIWPVCPAGKLRLQLANILLLSSQPLKRGAGEGDGELQMKCYGSMMVHHEKMKAKHEKIMKEMDARLDAKVAAMDAAKGEKKNRSHGGCH